MDLPHFLDNNFQEFLQIVRSLGEPDYRATQIWDGIFHNYYLNPYEMLSLPIDLRKKLSDIMIFSSIKPVDTVISNDGLTKKILFNLIDGKQIETVLMSYEKRNSLCISTQVGCAMGCVFCATGQIGIIRSLSAGEIIEQVLFFARELNISNKQLTNVVVMGMGEPFNNFDNVIKAIDILNDAGGYNFGERRFTISTVGIIPGILKFAEMKRQINLAISLHAINNQLRSKLIPINNKYPLETLLDSCRYYTSLTHRRVTFEWALINDVNDSILEAKELAKSIKGILCHVNLIKLNPTGNFAGRGSSSQKALSFQQELRNNGIPCSIRLKRGVEINAGCGQLAGRDII